MTECKLDKMVNKLNHILDKALDKSCPVAQARSIDPNNPWWTPQLKDMRHEPKYMTSIKMIGKMKT